MAGMNSISLRNRTTNRKITAGSADLYINREASTIYPDDPIGVTGLTAYFQMPDGSWVYGIDASWTAPDISTSIYLEKFLVQLSRDDGATYEDIAYTTGTDYRIAPLAVYASGDLISYKLRIKSVNNTIGSGLVSTGAASATINLVKDSTPPAKPAGLVARSIPRGIALVFTQPTEKDWALSKVYLSTVAGFTPNDATNLAAQGKATHFEIMDSIRLGGLTIGTTYYAKVIHVDTTGNESQASDEVNAEAIMDPDLVQALADAAQAIADAATAQGTADGKVATFLQATPPTAEGVGDLWIETDNGNKLYRWNGASWAAVQDAGIAQAISDAADAQSTADGKIVSFYQTEPPTASAVGDLWVDTNDSNKLYRWSGTQWISVRDAGIAQALADAAQGIADAATAQGTADGKVTTYYQAAIPTAEAIGDLWIDTDDNNKLYRAEAAGANEIKAGEWVLVRDAGIAAAISAAATAQSTADGKIVTFYQAAIPTSTSIGDLWVDTDDSNKLYRAACAGANEIKAGEWILIRDAGIAQALADAAQAIADAAEAQGTADGKVTTFCQTEPPTAEGIGDLWIDTNDANKLYRWSGATWSVVRDTGIAQAISDAADAQSTADGKIVTFYQASIPTSTGIGDLWIDTDDSNKLYRAAVAGATTIAAGQWVLVRDTGIATALTNAAQAIADAAAAQGTADGKVTTYCQAAIPTAEAVGDLWIDTDDSNKLYRAASAGASTIGAGAWEAIRDTGIASALTAASNAQTTANSRITTFYQTSVPTSLAAGDLWVDTDDGNKLYRAAVAGANTVAVGQWVSVQDLAADKTAPASLAGITLTAGSDTVYQDAQGVSKVRITLSLGSIPVDLKRAYIQIKAKQHSSTQYWLEDQLTTASGAVTATIDELSPGLSYDFLAVPMSFYGVPGTVKALANKITAGDTTAPPTPTGNLNDLIRGILLDITG